MSDGPSRAKELLAQLTQLASAPEGAAQGQPSVTITSSTLTATSGPLPPPQLLEAYARHVPSAPDRFIALVEREQKHRHRMDWSRVVGQYAGQLSGLFIATGALGGGIWLAGHDKPIMGFSVFFGGLGPLLGFFVWDRFRRKPMALGVSNPAESPRA